MKTGRTLSELAAEIERQANSKRDMIATTSALTMRDDATLSVGAEAFGVNELAHDQIGQHIGIPGKYYDKMRAEAPDLLANNVNRWLHAKPTNQLVRTMDGTVRAFLSDTYRPLENIDLAEAVLPTLMDLKLEIVSCEITARRFYLKCVDPKINRDIPRGAKMGDGSNHIFDTCVPALLISNSEVGNGRLVVETGMLTRACTNLAFFQQSGMKRRHVGTRNVLGDGDSIAELLSDRTKKLTDAAIWSQVQDVVKGAFDAVRFDAQIARITETTTQRIEADPVKVVEFTARKFGFTEPEKTGVLRNLIEGADLSRYGLFNAITRAAQDLDSYDRASEFEHIGADVIDLPQSSWREIANAAAPRGRGAAHPELVDAEYATA